MAGLTKKVGLIIAWAGFALALTQIGNGREPMLKLEERRRHLLEEEQNQVEAHAKMREIERYQMQIAQKFYMAGLKKKAEKSTAEAKQNFKAAASEYEKFLTLYERSPGGPYSLLMWAHCQVQLRLVNTAIREGFQSVIDYWPESHEATVAHFMIGKCHLFNGEPRKAEKVFQEIYSKDPKAHYATKTCEWMLDIAIARKDMEKQVELWINLVFKTPKNKRTPDYAGQLAKHHFREGEFAKGVEAIKSCHETENDKFIESVFGNGNGVTSEFFKSDASKPKAEKLGDEVISFLEERLPTDLSDKKAQERAQELLGWVTGIHMTLDRDKKVIATFERKGKLLGMDDLLLGQIAAWHKKKDRREQARSTYGRYEDKVNGRRAIAGTFREERKYEEAVRHYLALIGMDKEREATWQQDVVGTWRDAGQWDKAIATYRELLKVDPDKHSSWYWGIAECYEHKKQYSQAIQAYRQTDNYPEGYFRMAECNRHLKKWTEGLVLLNQAKAEKRVADRAQFRIAQFYEMAGQKEKCIKSFQMTCKLYPRSGYASRAHAHLQTKYGISVTLGGATDE